MAIQEPIDGREHDKSHRARLARRIEDSEKCRQERDADEEGNDHPYTRDLPKFGKTAISGRQE